MSTVSMYVNDACFFYRTREEALAAIPNKEEVVIRAYPLRLGGDMDSENLAALGFAWDDATGPETVDVIFTSRYVWFVVPDEDHDWKLFSVCYPDGRIGPDHTEGTHWYLALWGRIRKEHASV